MQRHFPVALNDTFVVGQFDSPLIFYPPSLVHYNGRLVYIYCNDQGIIFFRTWLPKLESLAAGVRCFFNVLVVNTHYDSWSDHLLGPQTTF